MRKDSLGSGYRCWLGYRALDNPERAVEFRRMCRNIIVSQSTVTLSIAVDELKRGLKATLSVRAVVSGVPQGKGFLILGVLDESFEFDALIGQSEKDRVNDEGFMIKKGERDGRPFILIVGKTDRGALYGVYCLLRLIQTGRSLGELNRIENPDNPLRMLNHWDNMEGKIERGYAGDSIFFRNNKFRGGMRRIRDYARLLASIGLNGTAVSNVNVRNKAFYLINGNLLPQVAKLADVLREYGIKLYLSINFASSMILGGLATADPLDPSVRRWWQEKAAEIYSRIPDFGGFLVKADSEFTPGPFTYGRNHADGANMLAEALDPYGGLVIWRCFVYNCTQDWRDHTIDRAKAAYDHFKPLDGRFRDNVLLQIKNGPVDFQVREPVSPLFGGLEKTNHLLELQITQEYTGQQKHVCYLVPQWKEVLDFDTRARGEGTNVAKLVNGSVFKRKWGGFAAVSNIGDDLNWTGHDLAQANFYGYGRLAWNPNLTSGEIAEEWVKLTFSSEPVVVDTLTEILMKSWPVYEKYTAPLGIGWMVNPGHHYGPSVDGYEYSKWGTYHRADCFGIGVDRTTQNGTGYTGQYYEANRVMYESLETCPENLLLFFHRLNYGYRLKSGDTLIQHIYNTHFEGVEEVEDLIAQWKSLKPFIRDERYDNVLRRLAIQLEDAKEWRDVINSYFYRKTGIPDKLGRKIY